MKKGLLLLAVTGLLSFSTTVFAASYRSDFLVFDGCPTCPDPCAQIATDLSKLCSGVHNGINGYITFSKAPRGGWDITVYLFHGAPGYPYQVKSNHSLLGSLIPAASGKGTLILHLSKAQVANLGNVICVFADCGAPQSGYPADCSHFNLLYATDWAFYK